MLKISLFGTPQITLDGKSLSEHITGRKLSLLIYLITTGRPHSRDVLANLLWSNKTNRRARKSLRDALPTLRRYLGKYMIVEGDTIAFNRKSTYWLDVEIFGTYIESEMIRSNLKMLHEVLDLYQDDFLPGFYIRNAPIFEQWLAQERERLQKKVIEGLFFLVTSYFKDKNYKAALPLNARLLTLEPWREELHQLQMKLLMEDGQRSAALEQYERCRKILAKEYEIEPLPETTYLYEQIKSDSSNIKHHEYTTVTDHMSSASLNSKLAINWEAIPLSASFHAREDELAHLESWLLNDRCQLVNIYGIVGQGKTALVANMVQRLATTEPQDRSQSTPFQSIIWYSLIDKPTIAQLLHFFLQKLLPNKQKIPETMAEQLALLVECLQHQRCLLVLDHVEQIIPTDKEAMKRAHEYELYNELWRWLTQNTHQSSMIVVGRIQPYEIARLNRYSDTIQTMCLSGLSVEASIAILSETAWQANEQEMMAGLMAYSASPLALTLLKEAIQDLSSDEIEFFLSDGPILFETLQDTLNEQLATLSPIEYDLLVWLAVINKPVTLRTLWNQFVDPYPKQSYLNAQRTLQRYGFLQNDAGQIILTPLLRVYLNHHLAEVITKELITYQETDNILDLFSLYLTQQEEEPEGLSSLFAKMNVSAFKKWKEEQSTTLTYLTRYRFSFNHHETNKSRTTSHLDILPSVLSRLLSQWSMDECAEKLRVLLIKEQKKEGQERSYVQQNLNHLLSLLVLTDAQP